MSEEMKLVEDIEELKQHLARNTGEIEVLKGEIKRTNDEIAGLIKDEYYLENLIRRGGKHQCSASTWHDHHSYQCDKNATVIRDGKYYCGIHDPVAYEARRKRREK